MAPDRQAHAVFEPELRVEKSRKIERIITRRKSFLGARVLEVGAGSGYMATAFAGLVGPEGSVTAVDRFDQRHSTEGYEFTQVDGTTLPFPDGGFDIVISNHVMEHVGEVADQVHHLGELRRVLAGDGVGYVAVPNRWRLVEPHFHLPFLSWFPPRLSSRYLRLVRKGDWYDVVPPSRRRMPELFGAAGLEWEDCTLEAMDDMVALERVGTLERALLAAPRSLRRVGLAVVPTMIYVIGTPGGPVRAPA